METSDIIALLALIIAAFSFGISIYNAIVQKRINTVNLEAKYYEKIFDKYLLDIIPEKLNNLKFENKKLNKNYTELIDVMMEMIYEAKYFQFSNPLFYKELEFKIKEFEDFILKISNKYNVSTSEQLKKLNEIEEEVTKIIKFIIDNHYKIKIINKHKFKK